MPDITPVSLRRTRIAPENLPSGAVLIDQLRERTLWSEGMFVTSQHFNRDQSYLITRHGDIGQAIGKGVVEGLAVTAPSDDPTALTVAPGLGIGGGGETIVVHKPVRISLGDIALQKALTQSAGLTESLTLIAESRSGLFVLCATPVEYSSNPIGSYATTAGGQRKLEDSVVNEAVLFTLVPYTLSSGTGSPEARRALAARRLFVDGLGASIPPASLPLAMVELDGNVLVWLDMFLVRRDAGAARADAFGLGVVDTPGRIAHYRQFDAMLSEMIAGSPGQGFAAHDRFEVLPPMGRMPAACVAPRVPAPGQDPVLSHNWLPSEVPVELVALPEDEIAQLLEESLTLPPIDLSADREALAQTPVSIIVPVPRADWADTPTEIAQAALTLTAAAPLGGTPQTPMALIRTLLDQDADPDLIDPTVSAEWLALLAGRNTLWYARRRQFLRTDALAGEAYLYQVDPPEEPEVEPPAPDQSPEIVLAFDAGLRGALGQLGLVKLYDRIEEATTPALRSARAHLNAALLTTTGAGSAVAATDLIRRALDKLDAKAMKKQRNFHEGFETLQVFSPFEGLLTGGLLSLEIPPFPGKRTDTEVSPAVAKALHDGVVPGVPAAFKLPDGFEDGVADLVSKLGVESGQADSIVATGGGAISLGNPRDPEQIRKALETVAEAGMTIWIRVLRPGSAEAQTRRNLLAATGLVPDLMTLFRDLPWQQNIVALMAHLTAMDKALTAATGRAATDAVTTSVKTLLETRP